MEFNATSLLGDLRSKVSQNYFPSPGILLTLNNDIPGLDGDLDPLRDLEKFLGVAVAQLSVHFLTFEWLRKCRSSPASGMYPSAWARGKYRVFRRKSV